MSEKHEPKVCGILTNYSTNKDGECKRFPICETQGRTIKEGCRDMRALHNVKEYLRRLKQSVEVKE